MSQIRKLAGQTAIYGLSSILGRVLNFLLVPLHTMYLSREEYGQNTDLYSLAAFLIVVLTYGFETAFFKFSEDRRFDPERVYSTAARSILLSSILFLAIFSMFHGNVVDLLRYQEHPEYVWMMFVIVCMDAIAAIPFARLRSKNRAVRFVVVKMALILTNVVLNLYFFWLAPRWIAGEWPMVELVQWTYIPNYGVGYVFLANLVASTVMLIMLVPEFRFMKAGFDKVIWRSMLRYGYPLMIAGLAGVANEMIDRQLIKYLLPQGVAEEQLGIYGAVYKLSIFLVLFNQAFRYAAEPFFFSSEKEKNAPATFARVMDLFVLILGLGFVAILVFLPWLKHFIDEKFWEGLYILPILLAANVFLGINTNLSVWYKLSGKTWYGMVITYVGLIFTLGFNLYLIPRLGYEGAAWATLVSYFAMMVTSYLTGARNYPIPYDLVKIGSALAISFVAGYLSLLWAKPTFVPQLMVFAIFLILMGLLFRTDVARLVATVKQRL